MGRGRRRHGRKQIWSGTTDRIRHIFERYAKHDVQDRTRARGAVVGAGGGDSTSGGAFCGRFCLAPPHAPPNPKPQPPSQATNQTGHGDPTQTGTGIILQGRGMYLPKYLKNCSFYYVDISRIAEIIAHRTESSPSVLNKEPVFQTISTLVSAQAQARSRGQLRWVAG